MVNMLPTSFKTGRTTVLVTPTILVPFVFGDENAKGILFKAPGTTDTSPNTVPVSLGEAGVTTTTGFALAPGESVVVPIGTANAVYGVASSNQVIMWMVV